MDGPLLDEWLALERSQLRFSRARIPVICNGELFTRAKVLLPGISGGSASLPSLPGDDAPSFAKYMSASGDPYPRVSEGTTRSPIYAQQGLSAVGSLGPPERRTRAGFFQVVSCDKQQSQEFGTF